MEDSNISVGFQTSVSFRYLNIIKITVILPSPHHIFLQKTAWWSFYYTTQNVAVLQIKKFILLLTSFYIHFIIYISVNTTK